MASGPTVNSMSHKELSLAQGTSVWRFLITNARGIRQPPPAGIDEPIADLAPSADPSVSRIHKAQCRNSPGLYSGQSAASAAAFHLQSGTDGAGDR